MTPDCEALLTEARTLANTLQACAVTGYHSVPADMITRLADMLEADAQQPTTEELRAELAVHTKAAAHWMGEACRDHNELIRATHREEAAGESFKQQHRLNVELLAKLEVLKDAWAVAKSLQKQVDIAEVALGLIAFAIPMNEASDKVLIAQAALNALEKHRES